MRRLTFVVLAGAMWLLLGGSYAFADNGPHVMGAGSVADGCAGCHRTHTAKSSRLQVQANLCYTCHGATGTGASTDVVSGVGYSDANRTSTPGALRGGGFSYALIGSAGATGQTTTGANEAGTVPVLATGAATTSTHTADGTPQMAWGAGAIDATGVNVGATTTMRCTSCHNPHGAGTYRALKPSPSSTLLALTAGTPVSITDTATKTYTTTNYWQTEDVNAPSFIANVSAWCSTCHTRYMTTATVPATQPGRTPSGDATYAYRHKSDGTTQGTPNCIQCHVAHGSNAAVGTYSSTVKHPDGTTAPVNDSRLLRIDNRGTCQMCHNR